MGRLRSIGTIIFFVMFIISVLTGCAETNRPAYTILDTIAPSGGPYAMSQGKKPVAAVGPVDVPAYVERAAAILDTTVSQTNISSIDQKVYVLKAEIPRVITENLTVLLAPRGASVVPYGRGSSGDFRIAVNLTNFDVTKFDVIETKAQWALYGGDGKAALMVKDISFSTPIDKRSDAGIRAAMSKSLADLTKAIAQAAGPVIGGK